MAVSTWTTAASAAAATLSALAGDRTVPTEALTGQLEHGRKADAGVRSGGEGGAGGHGDTFQSFRASDGQPAGAGRLRPSRS